MTAPFSHSPSPSPSSSPLSPENGGGSGGGSSLDDGNNSHNNGKNDKLSARRRWNQLSDDVYSAIRSVPRPPPTFNDPDTGNTRPAYLFPLFVLVNIVTMMDRSIIAGASQEFSAFVSSASDSPPFVKENPDAGIGLLQASFIMGYSVAIIFSGHYVHKVRWKPLVVGGMFVWWLGVLGSGNARRYDSFYVLLFSRMATGCSEAAFQVVAPPLIQDRGGDRAGLWLSVYLTGLPLGLAFGYIYGSRMAVSERWGWDWAFYWMCIASVPLIAALACVRDDADGGILGGAGERHAVVAVEREERMGDGEEDTRLNAHQPLLAATDDAARQTEEEGEAERPKFTIFSEIKACLTSPVLVSLCLGWAAIIGVVVSLGTFGGAFVLALELYDDERDAAYWFGITAALAGVIGTPLGGKLADRILIRYAGRRATTAGGGGAGRGEGVDDSLRWPIVASMVCRVNALVALALLFVLPTVVMHDAAYFLTFLFIGWTLLFMTQTGINMIAMLSVDRCHRPNALAFLMLTSHLLGDVPLPPILGLVKDKLAPSCRIDSSGEFVDPEGCKEENVGIRQSLAISYVWVVWSLIFFEATRRFAKREIGKARKMEVNTLLLREESGSEDDSSFRYYHSRFRPPRPSQNEDDDADSPLESNEVLEG